MRLGAKYDGETHINIYSQGQTQLGQFLSNFEYHPIETEDGRFDSIEGYWYWLGCTHENKDLLKRTSGYQAKKLGRELGSVEWLPEGIFRDKIKKAITKKLETMDDYLQDEFIKSDLPFTHYYVYGNKNVKVPQVDWIVEFITNKRKELRERA